VLPPWFQVSHAVMFLNGGAGLIRAPRVRLSSKLNLLKGLRRRNQEKCHF
jgi:hypothetical protein